MSKNLFDIIAEHDALIQKEAFVAPALRLGGALLRGVGGLGKAVLKRPAAAFGAAMTGAELGAGAKRFSDITAINRAQPYRVPRP